MQFILNLLYLSLDDFFENFNNIHLPSWVSEIVPLLTNVFKDINYFVPLETFFDVSIFCFNFNVALIVLKLILNHHNVNFSSLSNNGSKERKKNGDVLQLTRENNFPRRLHL